MASFPVLISPNVVTQYPYDEIDECVVSEATLECGISTTLTESDLALRKFVVRFPLIQRDDVATLENFFESMAGRLGSFTFVDDAGVTWNAVRFDQDDLEFQYLGPNQYSVQIQLSAEPQ